MQYIILTILSNVAIFMSFKNFERKNVNTLAAIVVNYVVCVITGIFYLAYEGKQLIPEIGATWFRLSMALGLVFVGTFYLMALTTQRLGLTVASVASKMSLVIPVVFSMFIFQYQSKIFTFWNYLGIVLALLAIALSTYPGKSQAVLRKHLTGADLLLPTFIFLLGGFLDTIMNYTNKNWLTTNQQGIFAICIFASAAVTGSIILIVKKMTLSRKEIFGGIYLGIPNYFSVYFLLKSLEYLKNDGAITYTLINIGIILTTSGAAVWVFREKLNKYNRLGILLAILAIFLISYQELIFAE